jgi:predicted alpha/beta-hydrolase family hydrolase
MPENLHKPARPNGLALVLTHSAGANAQAPLLVLTAEAFAAAGFFVLRYNLPFRQRKPFGPPSPATAQQDREGLRSAVQQMKEFAPTIYLGGHSYGGRQASMLAAEDPKLVAGLLLLSYPLHPPKKPTQLRTAHFPQLQTPTLFIHGTKDEFGTPDELTAALRLIPAKTELQMIEGAGHDLKRGNFDVQERIVSAFAKLLKPS